MYKVFYEEIENTEIDNNFKSEDIEISFWDLQYSKIILKANLKIDAYSVWI